MLCNTIGTILRFNRLVLNMLQFLFCF